MVKLSPARRPRLLLTAALGVVVVLATAALVAHAMGAQGGERWSRDGLAGETVHFLAVGHRGLVFAATETGVYRRAAGGAWTQVLTDPSVWAVALRPDDRTVAAGDLGGNVRISRDAGAHWRRIRLSKDGVYALAWQPGRTGRLLAGAAGGLYLSPDGGRHWQRRLTLHRSAGTAFAWMPGRARTALAGVVAGGPGGDSLVYVSRDAGQTWRLLGRGLDSHGGIMSLGVLPSGRIFAGTMGNRIWTVTPAGRLWARAWTGIPPRQHVSGITEVAGWPHTLVIGTLAAGVFRSDDAGAHWTSLSDGLPQTDGDRIVLSVAYDAARRVLLAGTTDGVYALPYRKA